MALLTPESELAGHILREPTIFPILTRFGIGPAVGDLSVADACATYNIDTDFMLAILNTYVNDEYFPERSLKSANIEELADYFEKTYAYYRRFPLSNIRRHLMALMAASAGSENNLAIIDKFFREVESMIDMFIERELNETLPSVRAGRVPAEECQCAGPDELLAMLDDFNAMMVRHFTGKCDVNLFYAVLTATTSFSRDFDKNCRIRSRILLGKTTR